MRLKEYKMVKKIITDCWQGKITLWKTYWGLTLTELTYILPVWIFVPENVYWAHSLLEIFSLFYSIFFLIAVWRSANKYKGWKVWYFLAKFTAVLFSIMQIFFALQFGEMFKLTY